MVPEEMKVAKNGNRVEIADGNILSNHKIAMLPAKVVSSEEIKVAESENRVDIGETNADADTIWKRIRDNVMRRWTKAASAVDSFPVPQGAIHFQDLGNPFARRECPSDKPISFNDFSNAPLVTIHEEESDVSANPRFLQTKVVQDFKCSRIDPVPIECWNDIPAYDSHPAYTNQAPIHIGTCITEIPSLKNTSLVAVNAKLSNGSFEVHGVLRDGRKLYFEKVRDCPCGILVVANSMHIGTLLEHMPNWIEFKPHGTVALELEIPHDLCEFADLQASFFPLGWVEKNVVITRY